MFGYGTSIPPNNNEPDNNDTPSKRVIFCVHGKLSGCCTVVKGLGPDDNLSADYQQNPAHRNN